MCTSKMFKPKMPDMKAIETKAPAQQAQTVSEESPDLDIEDEGSTKVRRERTRRGGLRIDVNMGGGGRVSRGTNIPR